MLLGEKPEVFMAGSVNSIADLSDYGFNVDSGIAMCGEDEEIYLDVLAAALEEGEEKIPLIRQLYENKDYERYCIEVHGLKNAARSIGADHLSDAAKVQEFAVKENTLEKIDEGIDALLEEYRTIVNALHELLD